MVNTSS